MTIKNSTTCDSCEEEISEGEYVCCCKCYGNLLDETVRLKKEIHGLKDEITALKEAG